MKSLMLTSCFKAITKERRKKMVDHIIRKRKDSDKKGKETWNLNLGEGRRKERGVRG